jgi:hypothetical protein
MSVQGQTEKNSVRAHVFRFALELGHCSTQSACLKGANSGNTPVANGVSRNVILCDMGGAGLLSHSSRRMGVTQRTGGLR